MCSKQEHNLKENAEGKVSMGERMLKSFKDTASYVGLSSGGDYRCTHNHMGLIPEDKEQQEGSERVAALDLWDEEMVEKLRAQQGLDQVIKTVLEEMKKVENQFGATTGSTNFFWKTVAEDQLNTKVEDGELEVQNTQLAVCDEIGMENFAVTKLSGKTSKLLLEKDQSTELYGATICGRLGWEINCIQFVVPFDDVIAASEPDLDIDPSKIITKNLKIWHGEGVEEISTEQNLVATSDNGHQYFFQVFLAALAQNTKDGGKKLAQCQALEELQTPEENTNTGLSQADCEASGMKDHFCSLPNPKTSMKYKIMKKDNAICEDYTFLECNGKEVSMCENANGEASQLEEYDKQYVYAQRFVDPSTCKDLIPIKKPISLFQAKSKKSGDSVIQSFALNRIKNKRKEEERKKKEIKTGEKLMNKN